jgi:hypothetical protein
MVHVCWRPSHMLFMIPYRNAPLSHNLKVPTDYHCSHHWLPGALDDLYSFDFANLFANWTQLAVFDVSRPSARYHHGFTSAGGKLYVHGGYNGSGKACEGSLGMKKG